MQEVCGEHAFPVAFSSSSASSRPCPVHLKGQRNWARRPVGRCRVARVDAGPAQWTRYDVTLAEPPTNAMRVPHGRAPLSVTWEPRHLVLSLEGLEANAAELYFGFVVLLGPVAKNPRCADVCHILLGAVRLVIGTWAWDEHGHPEHARREQAAASQLLTQMLLNVQSPIVPS